MLPENADYEEGFSIDRLADYELTGGEINLVIKNTAYKVATRKESLFMMSDFLEEIERELNSRFDSSKSMVLKFRLFLSNFFDIIYPILDKEG